jgi:DUF4097 and DUF4098 domain-containing protein YvlB
MNIERRERAPDRRAVRLPRATGWALLALVPGLAAAGSDISERKPADPAGQVEISNTSGSVTITGWTRSEVEVTGELGDGSERLEFTTAGKLTRVKVVVPKKSFNVESSDLVIKVPAASGLFVNTVSADVRVSGVQGEQRLQTVSADITTEAAAEDVECKSVSGDVNVNGAGKRGLLNITTVSGDATASKIAGEVNGSTVSGNFTLELGETTRSRLRSTSGDLGLTGRLVPDTRIDVESISGDVRLDLAGPADAEFDVSSFNGEIRNCVGPKAVRTDQYAPGRELRFREGQGSARVRVKTLNGDINVCRK